jgi:hypothetical protein
MNWINFEEGGVRPQMGEVVLALISDGDLYKGGYCLLEYTYNGFFTAHNPITLNSSVKVDKSRIIKYCSLINFE